MKLPTFTSYGEYKSSNYGANSMRLDFESFCLFFSYSTIVAFKGEKGLVVKQNDWSVTTDKHLNWIDGGSSEARAKRLPSAEFKALLEAELRRHDLMA